MPPAETYKKIGIGSQPTMCQVHTGAYVSLLAPGKKPTLFTASHPGKTITFIYHIESSHSRRGVQHI